MLVHGKKPTEQYTFTARVE